MLSKNRQLWNLLKFLKKLLIAQPNVLLIINFLNPINTNCMNKKRRGLNNLDNKKVTQDAIVTLAISRRTIIPRKILILGSPYQK